MQATALLKSEHEVIERVLDMLEQSVRRIQSDQPLPDGFAVWAVDFVRNFADGCHHAKEENVLFPLLERRGIPRVGGPIGCMLHEHELGRECVKRMAQAVDRGEWNAFAAAAADYAPLLRQHIFKENNVLFRLAEGCLSPEDDADAVARFQAAEEATGPSDHKDSVHECYIHDVARWERAFGGSEDHQDCLSCAGSRRQ